MSRKYLTILAILGFSSGLLIGGYYIYKINNPDQIEINNQIIRESLINKRESEFLRKITFLFEQYPAVSMVLFLNSKMEVSGSMYDGSRLNEMEYNKILSSYRKGKSLEISSYKVFKFSIYKDKAIHLIINNSAWLKNMGASWKELSVKIKFLSLALSALPLVSLFYLIRILFSAFFREHYSKKLKIKKSELSREEPTVIHTTLHKKEKEKERREYDFNRKITVLLNHLTNRFPVKFASVVLKFDNKKISEIKKMGGIIIHNEDAQEYTGIVEQFSVITHDMIFISNDKLNVYLPVMYRDNYVGVVHLKFNESYQMNDLEKKEVINLISEFSHSLFLQKIYNTATIDADTEFGTYPYFYFALRERLKTDSNFVVMVFEIPHIDRISPERIRGWATHLAAGLLKENYSASLYARLERGKFALLYELSVEHVSKLGVIQLKNINTICSLIEKLSKSSLHHNGEIHGGLFIRPAYMDDAESFIRKLEHILISSRLSKKSFSAQNLTDELSVA